MNKIRSLYGAFGRWVQQRIPMGFPWKSTVKAIGAMWGLSVLWSVSFFLKWKEQYDLLFLRLPSGKMVLRENAVMMDFAEVLGRRLWGFPLMVLAMAALAAGYYAYHYQGSKSIYVMKRLPDSGQLLRRCITIPALAAVISLLFGMVLLILYYEFYMNVTPSSCLTPGQWAKLWSVGTV